MKISSRVAPGLPFLCLWLLLQLWLPGSPALAAPTLLEDLRYRLEVLTWKDAARIRLTLNRVAPDRYEAEIVAETLGSFKKLSLGHRERVQTEMVWRHQQLLPLVYREESQRRGKRRLKEYRFDYDKGQLELWEWHEGKGMAKKWQTSLATQIYDPLSAYYNIRLGILKPNRAGESNSIPAIPYPQPANLEISLAATPEAQLKAMVAVVNPVFPTSRGQIFAYVDNQLVPQQAWTTIIGFTLRAWLLPGGVVMPAGLAQFTAPGSVGTIRPPTGKPPAAPAPEDPR